MAAQTVTLKPFNNVALAVGTQYHLVAPGPGNYYFQILNAGTANIAISNASTVAVTDPNSYLLPPNLTLSPVEWGPTGIWVAAGTAGPVSVALVPRQG